MLRTAHLGDGFNALGDAVRSAAEEIGGEPRFLHYLSLPPSAHAEVIEGLGDEGLAPRARIILEKPFGTDLDSARSLDELLHGTFEEEQIFRIDHYLGRDAVQNLLAMRFANGMYEPVWNRNNISHVQIDVPETLGIGMRASFYEQTGAFRDMVVTHLFQVLGFVAMEPPTTHSKAADGRAQKVFDAMSPIDPSQVVRGQYAGYRDEEGVAPDSDTETYVALTAHVNNWRWAGVPFSPADGEAPGAVAPHPHRRLQKASAEDVLDRHPALRREFRLRPPHLRARRVRAASRRASSPSSPDRRCGSARPTCTSATATASAARSRHWTVTSV